MIRWPMARRAGIALTFCVLSVDASGFTESSVSLRSAADPGSPALPATFFKPDGEGPFPAVVIIHDCSGLGPRSSGAPRRWAEVLVPRGYVVLMPDSFTPRGHAEGVCRNPSPSRLEVAPPRRVADAYAALAYLLTLPYVDSARVGLMGGSHGGTSTLATIAETANRTELSPDGKRARFAAGLALYPGCGARLGSWRPTKQSEPGGPAGYTGIYKPLAPVLILIGENDDWTPAEPCRKLAETAQRGGYPVSINVYPGAHHSFDSPNPVRYLADRVNPNAPGGRGATTGGHPEAWAQSIHDVSAFFERYLKTAGKLPR
jgi:dienelactone hydrolase